MSQPLPDLAHAVAHHDPRRGAVDQRQERLGVTDVHVGDDRDAQVAEGVLDRLELGEVLHVLARRAADQHRVGVLEPPRVPQPVEDPARLVGAVLRDLEVDQQPLVGVGAAVRRHVGVRRPGQRCEHLEAAADEPSEFRFLYPDSASLREKIETIATKVYGADGVDYYPAAARQLETYERNGFGNLPICIAKTHLSLSSDPSLKGAPTGWRLPVREVRASVGAGFVYPICGDMRTMPGLSATPAAHAIDIDAEGNIVNLS